VTSRTPPLVAGLASLALAACIERAPGSGGRQQGRDRAIAASYLASAAEPQHRSRAVFGNAIELLGWDLAPAELAPGRSAVLTLWWRTREETDRNWRVFVHLDGPRGQARIHGDHWPAAGTWPTDAWRKGEVVRDPVRLTVPGGYHGEAIEAWVGWYDGEERLHVTDAGDLRHDGSDRLLLAAIRLAEAG
jgi:hypothetical protein